MVRDNQKYYWIVTHVKGWTIPEVGLWENEALGELNPSPRETLGQAKMAVFLLQEMPVTTRKWKFPNNKVCNKITRFVSPKSLKELW